MTGQEYAITTHHADEVLGRVPGLDAAEDTPVLYCDSAGTCFFDESPNPYMAAIVEILNVRGEQGWILVQVTPREQDMICFWRREK